MESFRHSLRANPLALMFLYCGLWACSSSSGTAPVTGGVTNSGGRTATGGITATGGNAVTGGTTMTGTARLCAWRGEAQAGASIDAVSMAIASLLPI